MEEEGFSGTEEGPINRGQLLHKPSELAGLLMVGPPSS